MSRYDLYREYRRGDTTAVKAYERMKRVTEHKGGAVQVAAESIISAAIGTVIFSIVSRLFRDTCRPLTPATVWIESPSGETTLELPFFQGTRIARKHGWGFAAVQPIQPPRLITRREALSILLHGDKLGVI